MQLWMATHKSNKFMIKVFLEKLNQAFLDFKIVEKAH